MESIFISIASFRDPECPRTILSALKYAKNPYRVYIGVCQQNKDGDRECVDNSMKEWEKNISIVKMDYTKAQGPTYARYVCSQLYSGQTYYLQIDSHTAFVKDWDSKFINMYRYLLSKHIPKPVISYYPADYNPETTLTSSSTVPRICHAVFNKTGMIMYPGASLMKPAATPTVSAFTTGNTLFLHASFLKEVPYDPFLPHLFGGEEILFTVRLWTNGWDIFSPNENLTFHYYGRDKQPKYWDEWKDGVSDNAAIERVKYLLKLSDVKPKIDTDLEKYGMGTVRTVGEYYKFAGIDATNKTVNKNFCTGQMSQILLNGGNDIISTDHLQRSTIIAVMVLVCVFAIIWFLIGQKK